MAMDLNWRQDAGIEAGRGFVAALRMTGFLVLDGMGGRDELRDC
jgi:hypothetical protein